MNYKFLVILILFFFMSNNANAKIYDFSLKSIDGEQILFKSLKGKPFIIVNTASFCGYTYQFQQLQNLYEKYNKKNLIIIGIPSNDFGNQEFEQNKDVKEFCETKFNITFMLAEITKIKGENGHSLFKWIQSQEGYLSFPKWNFYKYLFDKNGNLIAWFSSMTKPNSKKFINKLEKIIK